MNRKIASARIAALVMFLGAGLVVSLPRALPAGTHTWTGATNANWSVAANWQEGTAPAPGESQMVLVFPQGAANQVNVNDIIGLSVDTVTLATAAVSPIYRISGNGITLNAGLSFDNPGTGGTHPEWQIPITLGGAVTISSSGRQSQVRGTVDLNGNALTFDCEGDIWVNGAISGSGSITKNLGSALTFVATNLYLGPTTANAGALYIQNGSALGNPGTGTTFYGTAHLGLNGGPFTAAEPITFAGGGIYAYGQNALSGMITLNAGVRIDVVNAADRLTISGPVEGNSGITKTGQGALVLSGTSGYAGLTEIGAGDLCVTGSIASAVSLAGSGARLTGSGSVGSISFMAAGAVYPQVDGTPAILTANGGFTGTSGAAYYVGLNSAGAGRLGVNGPLNLNNIGLVLDFIGGYFPPFGHTFKIIQNDGTDAVSGTFSGAAEGGLYKAGGFEFNVTYTGGTGNDVNVQLPLFRHAVANFDDDAADEAAVDFGSDGIWLLDNGTWTQISPANPESLIAGDIQADGDKEIVADLGTIGLWLWDGDVWSNLTSGNPEGLVAGDLDGDGRDEILADLGSTGLWLWDSGAWNILSSSDVESMVSGDVDGDTVAEAVADFGQIGLWLLNDGLWTQLSGANADFVVAADLDADSTAEVAVDFGPLGLWTSDGGAWVQRSGADADFIAPGSILGLPNRQIVGDFGSLGSWYLDGNGWNPLSTTNAEFFVCLNIDGLGGEDLLGDFSSWGLWRWNGAAWSTLSSTDPDFLAGGDLDSDGEKELLGDFGSLGLWLYDSGAWTQVSNKNAQ